MDPWPVIAIACMIGFGVAVLAHRRDDDRLRAVRAALGLGAGGDPLFGVRRLREEADRVELELADERRDHELLADLVEVGIVDLDPELRIVSANATAHAFVGRAPGTLLGLGPLEAFLDTGIEAIARTALDQGTAGGEVGLRGTDGPTLVVRARRSTAGGVWLVLADVSELRRLQQIRTEFIDNLSHELRTPLSTVSLLAETLSREADTLGTRLPPKMRDRIAKIEVETGHLVQMVNELMDLSRIESGGGLGLVEELDLGQLARTSTERLRLFADRQGVTLRVDVEPGLPAVRGDETRLGQVFVNLLHNAVKFSPNGGEVLVTVQDGEREVVAAVQDHGIGIPRAAQPRIFERFYKVDRARVRGGPGGTGLGLAIARHVVEQHGGRIWLESTEGVGSTFAFALPLVEGDD
ncbi:MAG TPA: ATP-binding protein [Clostridia bacterium]|nr:ATP-binding protein [Clostridia bacterium]